VVVSLSKDGRWTDYYDILGMNSFKKDISIDTTFSLLLIFFFFLLDNMYRMYSALKRGLRVLEMTG
jgi:hypothetical protein